MKGKTKILSTIMTCVTVVVSIVCYFVAINKNKSKQVVYAESVCFTNGVGGCELFIDNELILDSSLVTIVPANCSFQPEFSVVKYGSDSNDIIKTGTHYKFKSTGKYIVKCSVKSGEYDTSYTSATMTVKVVDEPTLTNMHILPTTNSAIDVGQSIDISTFANITYPDEAKISITTSQHLRYSNGNITALKGGKASVEITLKLFNIFIYHKLNIDVIGEIMPQSYDIKFTFGQDIYYNNDEIKISLSSNSYALGYQLLNFKNQQIICSTNNNNIVILISEAPFIVFQTLNAGRVTIFITPIENPSATFEVYLIIE